MRYLAFSIIFLLLASPALAGDYGLNFGDTSDSMHVKVDYDADLNCPDGLTMEAFIWFDNLGTGQLAWGKAYDATHTSPYFEYCWWVLTNTYLQMRMNTTVWTPDYSFSPDEYYHIAWTADGTKWRFWVNDAFKDSLTESKLPANTNSQPLLFGVNIEELEDFMGRFAGARLYNAALDSATLASHYNYGMGDCTPQTDDLKGWWMFATGSGTTAYDSSGNGNDGSFLPAGNPPTWVTGMGLACNYQTEWRYPTEYNLGTNWTDPDLSREHDSTCASYNATTQDYLADHVYDHNVPSGATVDSIHVINHGYGTDTEAERTYYCALTKDSINVLGSAVKDTLASDINCSGSSDHIVKFASPSMSAAEANARGMGVILYDGDTKANAFYFDVVLSKVFYTPEGEAAYGGQVIFIGGQ